MATQDNYRLLVNKLDQFIRKFYINQVIRGVLYSVGFVLALFLVVTLLEYYNYFDTGMRKLLFFSFIGFSLLGLSYWVFLPLLHYFRLGKIISHEKAAQIIGDHFSNVKDKLLNVLQLRQQYDSTENRDLILASINQKSEEIKPVPFKNAIDLRKNKKYLPYALPPLLLLLLILFINASLITDSTTRLIKNNQDFEKPAPFTFVIDQEKLQVVQYEDYPLNVQIQGDQLPNEVFITIDGYQYRLTKEAPDLFTYRFNKVQEDVEFHLASSGIESREYTLDVMPKPNVLGFEVKLDYPAYTQRKDESLNSVGDLVLPVGTNIDWIFSTENTDNISLRFEGDQEVVETKRFSGDLFNYKKRAMRDQPYKLYISNKSLPNADSIGYAISIIPDLYPDIAVERVEDSTDNKLLFFLGSASDDYGLLSLSFNYRIKKADGKQGELVSLKLQKPTEKQMPFNYLFDLHEIDLAPGDEVTYYFEVYDNDGVNGSKSARTNLMVFNMPTVKEFEAMEEENDQQIKEDLEKALKESKEVQEEMKRLREEVLQKKELDWQSRKELEKLLDRQKNLEQKIQDAKQAFEENLKNQEEFSETDERIMEKQEQIQEMMEEVMSEEMQELMRKIEELLEEMGKNESLEMMEEMEMSDEQLEMELDRMLELFKQLELEQEMQDAIDKLEELAEKQEELSEETEKGDKDQEELEKKQEEIDEEFKELKEKMEDIEKKNEELEQPKEIGDREEDLEDIQQDIDQSQEQLQQQQNSKASKSQKSAAKKMQEMAQAMAAMMEMQEMEQMEEDMKALRQLLENLVGLSFDQEKLIDDFNKAEVNTPRYVDLVQQQFKIKDNFRLVEDSLQALSKRVFQIESFVTEKVSEIKGNMRDGLEDLEERRKPQAADHQQRVMKNLNDLALMLSETMNQMQQQMAGMMSGNQMCNKPGGQGQNGNVPKDKLSQGQDGLNKQMKSLKERMEKGMGKPSSKEFAEMAARQAALRNALKDKQKKLQEQGKGSQNLQDIIEQMDKIETDLVNKTLTNEMLKRQEDIMTRLLEHEQAEREREYDEQRKAEQGDQREKKLPPSLEEYLKKREAEIDLFKTVSPSLKPYYRGLVEEYQKNLKKD
ncbi:MAG TPA: DUF4175 domain-containing protein [Saprospiraceae bacterium]|nr:DUF4175 domain-containing protein [Saprospiraceae bacterium]HMQ82234.1 DUF4175 domain-containing protein [Saprospiraceae bacterium]